MKNNLKAHLAVLFTNILFGINYSIVQYIIKRGVRPFGLNLMRVAVCTLLFWAIIFIFPTKAGIKKQHIPRFILCAVTGIVINQLLFLKGLSLTLSIHAALLSLVTPVFITFVAAWLINEPVNIFKVTGLILAVSGAVMLVASKDTSGSAKNVLLGDILVLLNAISYAFYFVLVRPLMKAYDPIQVIRWVFTIGSIFIIPIGWSEFASIEWQSLNLNDFLALFFIIIGSTFFAYLFNLYGIYKLGASVTGAYIYTQPVFATLIAIFFLNEKLTVNKILAAILIAAGVLVVNRNRQRSIN